MDCSGKPALKRKTIKEVAEAIAIQLWGFASQSGNSQNLAGFPSKPRRGPLKTPGGWPRVLHEIQDLVETFITQHWRAATGSTNMVPH